MTARAVRTLAMMALLLLFGSCSRMAFQTPEEIREEILKAVPLGSSVTDIDGFVATHDHKPWLRVLSFENPDENRLDFWDGPAAGYVSAIVGRYTLIWTTDVVAYWILDEDQRVTDLVIRKYQDAL